MKSLIRIGIAAALALAVAPIAHADLWLHLRVTESGSRPSTVKINLPYTLVERVAPLVDEGKIDDGEIAWNGEQVEVRELRETWRALRSGKGGVTKDGATWKLDGAGVSETLVIHENDDASGTEVRIPARLVDALLSSPDRLDFQAAARVIATVGSGELLAVDEDGTRVRMWVDSTPAAE
ncbi:MAG: hypothetical protein WC538_05145 [Thermoanaerobaculia bacterium]|jgi:hypothetical protein